MQIKKKVLFISILFIFFATAAYSSEFNTKIGVVDYNKILTDSEAGKSAMAKINSEAKKIDQIIREKAAEIEKKRNQLKTEASILSQERRKEEERSLFHSINEFRALQRKSQIDFKRFQDKIFSQIREEMLLLTEELGKNKNYFLILDKQNILFARTPIDITKDLIREYNEKFITNRNLKNQKD